MNAFDKAIEKILGGKAKISVMDIREPVKKEKAKSGPCSIEMDPDWRKPSLYLSDDDIPAISKLSAGDVVHILVQAKVRNTSTNERTDENGKTEKRSEACLVIERMAEVK